MTASDRLAALRARYGVMLSASKLMDDPLARALYWKRQRWELAHILANDFWPDDPRYDGVDVDLCHVAEKHSETVQAAWDARRLERLAASVHVRPSLDERRRHPVIA